MSSPAHTTSALTAHTFGHFHMEPPPLPSNLQTGDQVSTDLTAADAAYSLPGAAGIFLELDQLVRSIGEW